MKGLLHSIQTIGTLDGPGLRTVVFLQGCPLHCKFCHSIDTTLTDRGEEIEVEELFERVIKYREYWDKVGDSKTNKVTGGVTISGGDPLQQPLFLEKFTQRLKESEVHTTVETSLFSTIKTVDMLYDSVDLWMVSLKHMDPIKHKELTTRGLEKIHENLSYLDGKITDNNDDKQIRIRFVVIPGVTDSRENVQTLAKFVSNIKNLELLELLPYVDMGKYKWYEIYGKYEFDEIREAERSDLERVEKLINEVAELPIKRY
jgi:pyruvate formate lyase activating enzyme